MHATHLVSLACCCALLWLVWRVLHHYRLPRLPEQKLTRELIQQTLLECTSPLVRLPASHGVLVTDPRLARKLLEGVSHTGLGIGLATRGVGQPHRVRVRVGVNTGLGLGVATQGVSHTGL